MAVVAAVVAAAAATATAVAGAAATVGMVATAAAWGILVANNSMFGMPNFFQRNVQYHIMIDTYEQIRILK